MTEHHNPFEAPTVEATPPVREAAVVGEVASPGRRLAGAVADQGVGAVVPLALIALVLVTDGTGGPDLGAALVLLALLWAVAVLAAQAALVTYTGQTVGKRLVGTRIVRTDGSPCGFVHGVLVRWIAFTFGVGALHVVLIGYVISLVDALMVFRADRRTLHDLLADTVVVRA